MDKLNVSTELPILTKLAAPCTLFFASRIKTKENPEIGQLSENENIELFQEERIEPRRKAEAAIAGIQEENKRCYNKKEKHPVNTK